MPVRNATRSRPAATRTFTPLLSMHSAFSGECLKPSGHGVHCDSPAEKKEGIHCAHAIFDGTGSIPAAHDLHLAKSLLNKPTGHETQALPSGPTCCPGPHVLQASVTRSKYASSGQGSQLERAGFEIFPAGHSVHDTPSVETCEAPHLVQPWFVSAKPAPHARHSAITPVRFVLELAQSSQAAPPARGTLDP